MNTSNSESKNPIIKHHIDRKSDCIVTLREITKLIDSLFVDDLDHTLDLFDMDIGTKDFIKKEFGMLSDENLEKIADKLIIVRSILLGNIINWKNIITVLEEEVKEN